MLSTCVNIYLFILFFAFPISLSLNLITLEFRSFSTYVTLDEQNFQKSDKFIGYHYQSG